MQRYNCNTIEPIDDFKLKGIIYAEPLDSVNFCETIRMEKSILDFLTKQIKLSITQKIYLKNNFWI